jgi:hypothetical protein
MSSKTKQANETEIELKQAKTNTGKRRDRNRASEQN